MVLYDQFADSVDVSSIGMKNDHSAFAEMENYGRKLHYNKGNYDGLRKFLTCDWKSEINAEGNTTDSMWKLFFKNIDKIEAFIYLHLTNIELGRRTIQR